MVKSHPGYIFWLIHYAIITIDSFFQESSGKRSNKNFNIKGYRGRGVLLYAVDEVRLRAFLFGKSPLETPHNVFSNVNRALQDQFWTGKGCIDADLKSQCDSSQAFFI